MSRAPLAMKARALTKRYATRPGRAALDAVNLRVEPGEFVAIAGRSGSGKSTLLHILGALDRDFEGSALIGDLDLRSAPPARLAALRNRSIGFVFQQFHLLEHLSAIENVALGSFFGPARRWAEIGRGAEAALERVGLGAAERRARPGELSGGQRQRVALARALFGEPGILLCDEPTGSLDASTGEAILSLFSSLHAEGGRSVVMITHDAAVAAIAERVIHLEEGRIVDGVAPMKRAAALCRAEG